MPPFQPLVYIPDLESGGGGGGGGLETAFDLAAFGLSLIAPVNKTVNHPRTVANMRVTGWE